MTTKNTDDFSQLITREAEEWFLREVNPDANEAIRWIVQTVGPAVWLRRADELLDRCRKSEWQFRAVLERHYIEVCIAAGFRRLAIDRDMAELATQPFLTAFCFAQVAQAIHRQLSPQGRVRHIGKMKQALKEDYGFAALQTEHTAMMMGFGIGCNVLATDLEAMAPHDLLLSDQGQEVELECKLLTHDFGHPFRQSEFQRLCGALSDAYLLKPGESCIAWLTLKGTLPRQDSELRSLAQTIGAAATRKRGFILPQYVEDLTIEDWPLGISEPQLAHSEARFISVFQECCTFALVGDHSALILGIIAPLDTKKTVEALERKFKDAADQLSGTRPGIIFAELEGPNFDLGITIKIVSLAFKKILARVFRERPYLELVIVGFPGPPFSSGASIAISNPRRKRRNRSFISLKFERNARPRKIKNIPFKDFRQEWWRAKYQWDKKTPEDVLEARGRARSAAAKQLDAGRQF